MYEGILSEFKVINYFGDHNLIIITQNSIIALILMAPVTLTRCYYLQHRHVYISVCSTALYGLSTFVTDLSSGIKFAIEIVVIVAKYLGSWKYINVNYAEY